MAAVSDIEKTELHAVWQMLVSRVAFPEKADGFFEQLLCAYTQSHRHYHTCTHLLQMLGVLGEAGVDDDAVYWATFYHDYCYIPGKSDNEQKSAAIALEQLSAMGVERRICDSVAALIIATRDHHIHCADQVAAMFLDADMAILGAAPTDYSAYAEGVRREFSSVPSFLFNIGRRRFLRESLARERIYASDWFFSRYEQMARANVRAELESL
jgi:predicted metal-dependent HD superfamily phosphohydrolase